MDKEILINLVNHKMPYGKYADTYLCDLPVSYLEWMARSNAFPAGKLGMELQTLLTIKQNGLEDILRKLKADYRRK